MVTCHHIPLECMVLMFRVLTIILLSMLVCNCICLLFTAYWQEGFRIYYIYCFLYMYFVILPIIIIIIINKKKTFVSYLNSPRKGCPRVMKICVWTHLGLIKWKTTSTKNKIFFFIPLKFRGKPFLGLAQLSKIFLQY